MLWLAALPDLRAQADNRQAVEAHLRQAQLHLQNEEYAKVVEELKAAQALHAEIPGSYYQLGLAYFELGQIENAERAFQAELKFEPPDPFSLYYLGRIRSDAGHTEEAIRFYEAALEHGNVLDVRGRLGTAYLRLGQADRAVAVLEQAVRAQPEVGELHFVLGRAYRQLGREADARHEFDETEQWQRRKQEDIRRITELRRLLQEKKLPEAIELVRQIRTSKDAHILLAVGIALGQHQANQLAEEVLKDVVELMPSSPEAQFNLGRARASQENWTGSLDPLGKAVELRPEFYEAQVLLGTALVNLSRTDEAIRHLRAADELRPGNGKLLAILGLQYLEGQYYHEAIATLRRAIDTDGADPTPYFLLIQAHFKNHDFERALTVAQETAGKFPELPRSHIELATQFDNLGRLEEAQASLERILAKDPGMPMARVMLGDILSKQGRAEESITEFKKALQSDRTLTRAYAGLGKVLIQLKRYDEAVTTMKQGIAVDANVAALHLHLSQAYRALGKHDAATAEVAIFTKLNREEVKLRDQDVVRTYEPK